MPQQGQAFLIVGKIVFLADHRQVLESRQVPPATPHAANGLGLHRLKVDVRWQILRIDRPILQLLAEAQQQLRDIFMAS